MHKHNNKVGSVIVLLTVLALYIVLFLWSNETDKIKSDYETKLIALNKEVSAIHNKLLSIEKRLLLEDVKLVTVTAYTPSRKECDSDYKITASMKKVRPGMVAVSEDLFNVGWTFGKKIYIEGVGVCIIEDLVSKKKKKHIDILMFDKKEAKKFGTKQDTTAAIMKEH